MKMEQVVQCVSKRPGRHYVVEQLGNVTTIAEFELLFPEVGKIASLLSVLVAEVFSHHLECNLQSCFSHSNTPQPFPSP